MPPQAADLEEALKKKGGLTLSQLANYDDLITDALVDRVYFWSNIRKLKPNYHPSRGVLEQDVCKIIQDYVIIEKDPATAQDKLLLLPGLAKYHKALGTIDEKDHFVKHLRKYVNIYLPDCPFEVGTTNRYTIETAEAAIVARKHIRKGETIRYLSGIQVEMTEKEEEELTGRTDFSIVISSRRKRPSLFLGPARFANHDCDANAMLNTTGPHGIHIVARKHISVGDEITVTYGEDYFGIDNCECLCSTCESLLRNGWDPLGPVLHDSSDEDDSDDDSREESSKQIPPTRRRKAGPSPTNKRKREHDRDEDQENHEPGHATPKPAKRPVGRPRKYPRTEDQAPKRKTDTRPSSSAGAEADRLKDERGRNGRFLPKSASAAEKRNAGPWSVQKPGAASNAGRGLSSRSTYGRTLSEEMRHDPILDKVLRLLGSCADRKEKGNGSLGLLDWADSSTTESSGPGTPAAESDLEEDEDAHEFAKARAFTETNDEPIMMKNGRSTARGVRGRFTKREGGAKSKMLSRKNSTEMLVNRQVVETETAPDPAKHKLAQVKMERSMSNLRHVVSATDSQADPYSVPDSPAPAPAPAPTPALVPQSPPKPAAPEVPVKRGRGRPRKYPRKEEVGDTTGGSSPSSLGTDSSSQASLASSATSMDTFGAGNIAQGICDMLTNGPEPDEVGSTQTTLQITVTKAQSSSNQACSSTSGKDSSGSHLLSADKLDRGRDPLRKSPRSGPVEPTNDPMRSIEKMDLDTSADSSSDVKRGEIRTPGDYTLCKALLCTQYHRWIECRNCDEIFLQGEAYLTRIACPRCERHSKLYGYYWPKTDKEGKHDREERVLDHRTIHRFIDPEEERSEPKGRKSLADVVREQEASSGRLDSEDSEGPAGRERKLRLSPRRSESRKKLRATM